jgi:hypothetical protein
MSSQIGNSKQDATPAKSTPHPLETLARIGGPMAGDELDLASVPLKPYWKDVAVASYIDSGLAKTREEALKLLDEEI